MAVAKVGAKVRVGVMLRTDSTKEVMVLVTTTASTTWVVFHLFWNLSMTFSTAGWKDNRSKTVVKKLVGYVGLHCIGHKRWTAESIGQEGGASH